MMNFETFWEFKHNQLIPDKIIYMYKFSLITLFSLFIERNGNHRIIGYPLSCPETAAAVAAPPTAEVFIEFYQTIKLW